MAEKTTTGAPNLVFFASEVIEVDQAGLRMLMGISEDRFEQVWSGQADLNRLDSLKLAWLLLLRGRGHALQKDFPDGIEWRNLISPPRKAPPRAKKPVEVSRIEAAFGVPRYKQE